MSDLASKLAPQQSHPGRPRRTLGSLRSGSGRLELVEGTEEFPLRFIRTSMGRKSSWSHIGGRGPTSIFECTKEW